MAIDTETALAYIVAERQRQKAKWHEQEPWHDSQPVKLAVVLEEVLEATAELNAVALRLTRLVNDKAELNLVFEELVQVGALAVKWLESFYLPALADQPPAQPSQPVGVNK